MNVTLGTNTQFTPSVILANGQMDNQFNVFHNMVLPADIPWDHYFGRKGPIITPDNPLFALGGRADAFNLNLDVSEVQLG